MPRTAVDAARRVVECTAAKNVPARPAHLPSWRRPVEVVNAANVPLAGEERRLVGPSPLVPARARAAAVAARGRRDGGPVAAGRDQPPGDPLRAGADRPGGGAAGAA